MRRLKPKMIRNSRLQSTSESEVELKASEYTVTFDSRDIYITDIIDSFSIQHALESINAINKLDDFEARNYAVINCEYVPPPINIYINSPGGCAMAALGLITTIESSETPVHTHCIGEASSAALFIFSVGHVRHAYKHSIFMYHQLSSGAVGTFKDIEDQVETLKHLQERLEEIFIVYTKFTKEELEGIRSYKKDYTFYFQEALEKGLADKIILNSLYSKDLESLKNSSNIDVRNSVGESLSNSESDLDDEVLDDDELEELIQKDLKTLDIIADLTDEELQEAIDQFIQNKNNSLEDNSDGNESI